ncbi:unnamed protein product [Pleuronectes platessa]|uniref:Uncharacterized protein n=1 Tax=Pleuronectes platessa TaxID=8262 RepID=A0A9N7YK48_PLEPL|nr:unnamed protein product [Pleuronectes platessa]
MGVEEEEMEEGKAKKQNLDERSCDLYMCRTSLTGNHSSHQQLPHRTGMSHRLSPTSLDFWPLSDTDRWGAIGSELQQRRFLRGREGKMEKKRKGRKGGREEGRKGGRKERLKRNKETKKSSSITIWSKLSETQSSVFTTSSQRAGWHSPASQAPHSNAGISTPAEGNIPMAVSLTLLQPAQSLERMDGQTENTVPPAVAVTGVDSGPIQLNRVTGVNAESKSNLCPDLRSERLKSGKGVFVGGEEGVEGREGNGGALTFVILIWTQRDNEASAQEHKSVFRTRLPRTDRLGAMEYAAHVSERCQVLEEGRSPSHVAQRGLAPVRTRTKAALGKQASSEVWTNGTDTDLTFLRELGHRTDPLEREIHERLPSYGWQS